jgi:cation diffusion facilitator family transporter
MLLHTSHDPAPMPAAGADPAAARAQRLAMRASLGVAVLMLAGKTGAYTLTGSTAILSDALESVIHLFATGVAAFSLWYAAQPPDPTHPYGHGKVAYFSSGFEGALILIAALGIFVEAGRALAAGPELQRLGAGLAITAVLALVNLALGLTLIRTGRRTNALVLVANGRHVLTDMWTSLGVLVGIGLVWATGLVWLDPVVAMLAGANILWTAGRLLRDAYAGLMERADPADTARVLDALRHAAADGRISGFHHVRHRRVNDLVWIEVHLLLPDALPLDEAHRRATAVEAELGALFPEDRVHLTSHLEPASHEHPAGLHHETVQDALSL